MKTEKNQMVRKLVKNDSIKMNVQQLIKSLREESGFTQAKSARLARLTQEALSKIENGSDTSIDVFIRIIRSYGYEIQVKKIND